MKRYFYCLLIPVSVLFSPPIRAQEQTGDEQRLAAEESSPGLFKKIVANNRLKNNNYYGALDIYLECYKANPADPQLNYKLGICLFKLKKYRDAAFYFKQVISSGSEIKRDVHLYLGKCFQFSEELDSAALEYTMYKEKVTIQKASMNKVNDLIAQCKYAREKISSPVKVLVKNAGDMINTEFPDYAPIITNDGKLLIFTSRRNNSTGRDKDPEDLQFYEDVYITSFDNSISEWTTPRGISEFINSPAHDANIGISPDGNTLLLYKNIRGGDIYQSRLGTDGTWFVPSPMPLGINSVAFEGSASITSDGKTIYFVSNRKGGFGNGDIYKCSKQKDDTWGLPELLDSTINTPEDEISVYVKPNGKTIYFSSMGHQGLGGYDIFKSDWKNGKFTEPENMGYPINSTNDDLQYYPAQDGKTAWLSSIRKDSKGDRDIYMVDLFQKPDSIPPKIDSLAKSDSASITGKSHFTQSGSANGYTPPDPLLSSGNSEHDSNPVSGIEKDTQDELDSTLSDKKRLIVAGKVIDQTGKGISAEIAIHSTVDLPRFITDDNGVFLIEPKNNDLSFVTIEALKTGFIPYGTQKLTVIEDTSINATKMYYELKLKNVNSDTLQFINRTLDSNQFTIVFEFGSAHIPYIEANPKMDEVVSMMYINRKLKVTLEGHADIIGTPLYNKQLSISRAMSAASYLERRGIPKSRIIVVGYGSSLPIATNETEEGRRTNRRIEIKLK